MNYFVGVAWEMIGQIISVLIAVLSGSIMSYIMAKIMVKNVKKEAEPMIDKAYTQVFTKFRAFLNEEDGQKMIYSLGVLMGNGARTGLGIQKTGGKFKIQDLIMQGVGQYIQSKIQGVAQPTSNDGGLP